MGLGPNSRALARAPNETAGSARRRMTSTEGDGKASAGEGSATKVLGGGGGGEKRSCLILLASGEIELCAECQLSSGGLHETCGRDKMMVKTGPRKRLPQGSKQSNTARGQRTNASTQRKRRGAARITDYAGRTLGEVDMSRATAQPPFQ